MESQPHYLSRRGNWEAVAVQVGGSLEKAVASTLESYLSSQYPDTYSIETHPGDFKQLYLEFDYQLHPTAYNKPATVTEDTIRFDSTKGLFLQGPTAKVAQCGCIPDIKITSKKTGHSYYIECKAQKDEGNAQERACKYATPSFLQAIRDKLKVSYHPIGYLFSGQLITKRKYILELQLSFGFAPEHLLLWDTAKPEALISWFEATIRPTLNGPVA